jgi:hypothetical protein
MGDLVGRQHAIHGEDRAVRERTAGAARQARVKRFRRGSALLLAAAVIAGCASPVLRTAPAPADVCDDALASGRLVTSRQSGLALVPPEGAATLVIWPFGYGSRGFVGSIELVDEKGTTVAREGQFVQVGGGLGVDGFFVACAGSVQVVAAPS